MTFKTKKKIFLNGNLVIYKKERKREREETEKQRDADPRLRFLEVGSDL